VGAAPAAAAPRAIPAAQDLVTLLAPHTVAAELHDRSRVSTLQAWRPITGGPTVLPVVGRARTDDGARWLRVVLPGRPNGRTGWITQRQTLARTTVWHVVVRTTRRRVQVYRRGRLLRTFKAIVGTSATPTPRGRTFVEESIRMLPGSAGAPFALALGARSDVLQEFAGGPGQIAIHGTGNLSGRLGSAASHGCVRLGDRAIRWLASRIAPGVPVTIR
jgi:lipoprotein-anchoring transpeptidase ErfK/SrfK